jgi:hypothetical protein
MDIYTDLRQLCSQQGPDGYSALQLLATIVRNIIDHPNDSKYRTVSAKSKLFRESLAFNEFFTTLITLGFKRKVEQFEEKWYLTHVNPIVMAKLQDTLVTIEDLLDRYKTVCKPPSSQFVTIKDIQTMKTKKQEYWTKVSKDAEESRLEKLERESRALQRLRNQQQKKSNEIAKSQEAFRNRFNLLSKPPEPPKQGDQPRDFTED